MEPFKNLMSEELVGHIGHHLSQHIPSLNAEAFATPIVAELPKLELKQRAALIADHIHQALPQDPDARRQILTAILHPNDLDSATQESGTEGLCGWGIYPLTMVVGQHGLDDFDASLELLREMTKRGTSEFDVRPFIAQDPERAIAIIGSWGADPNVHVRRLVSEGTRPRLPWGMRLKSLVADPSPTLPLMKSLRDDPEEYVRRSVANHLNDIAKDHPDLIAELALDWMKGADRNRERLLRHACRTLIKQGHPTALEAFGIKPPQLDVPDLTIETPVVPFGTTLSFSTTLTSQSSADQKLIIDYVVHFRKANGTLAPKVFKLKQVTLGAKERITLERRHAIRPITTRTYYSGIQTVALRINGLDFNPASFELDMSSET
ncbi:MAG: DNA alkylation repair protein [Pseudoruegeria sp.]